MFTYANFIESDKERILSLILSQNNISNMADIPALEMWTVVDVNSAAEKDGSGRIIQCSKEVIKTIVSLARRCKKGP